jgi:hypothetical protein
MGGQRPALRATTGKEHRIVLRHHYHQVRAAAVGLLLGGLLTIMSVAVVFADSTGPPFPR